MLAEGRFLSVVGFLFDVFVVPCGNCKSSSPPDRFVLTFCSMEQRCLV